MTIDGRYQPYALAILRIVTALLFMQDGAEKMHQFPQAAPNPVPFHPLSLNGVTAILELFGGLHILVGITTRITAFILAGQMALTYALVHLNAGLDMRNGIFPSVNGGDLAVLFCFVYLYILIAGPGAWSIDGVIARRRLKKAS